jgi:Zn finger protein HypA/HybF involved in hydrogenase expression
MQKIPRITSIIKDLLQRPVPISEVQIAVGELIPFTDEQIQAQWKAAPLRHIILIIRRIPAQYQCMTCFEKYHPSRAEVSCPNCGSVGAKILAGEEFYLEADE